MKQSLPLSKRSFHETSSRGEAKVIDGEIQLSAEKMICGNLRSLHHHLQILLIPLCATPSEVMLARQQGAAGYLNKSVDRDALLAAIERVAVGDAAFQVATPGGEDSVVLSPRELEVLNQLGRGLGNKELGVTLGVGGESIKSHLKAVFLKLEVSGRAEAVARGYELGLISAASQPESRTND